MTEKLVLVASNDGILKHAREVTDEGGYDAVILYGELEGAIPQVQSILDRKEFRVFVSRGGTARFLRERFNLPIVEIAVTGQDILRALHPYAGSGKKLAVIGWKNVIAGAREIADILGEEIIYLETRDSDAVPGAIEEARAAGADIIVGDHHVTRRAEALGLPVVRIDSGKAAVEQAFQEAARLYAGTVQEKLRNRRFQTIMESIEEAVIAIDENGLITTFNPGAEKIFSTPERDAIGKRIETVVPNTVMPQVLHSGQELVGVIMDAGKTVIASSVKPLVVDGRVEGVVSTFRDITKIQQLEAKIRAEVVKKRLSAKKRFDEIIHASARMKDVIGKAVKYAKVDSTILILGESGTGKEILAQAIHNGSARHGGAFVAFNCAALPDNLLESELFGYVDGSFTGARKEGKKGLFEMAHGGTILLDEISEMNLNIQARILRVIQEKEVMRLGDDKIIPVDVRILAATNQNLWQCVQDGTFRQDLFYRLNVLNLTLPPLRDRREDVEPLARLFLAEFGSRYEASVPVLGRHELETLRSHDWPGNVRELQNVMERYVISGRIGIDDFSAGDEAMPHGDDDLLDGSLEAIETRIIRRILESEGYNKTSTAKRLGISRTTLDKKIRSTDSSRF